MTDLELVIIAAIKGCGRPLSELSKMVGIQRDAMSKFVNGKASLSGGNLGKLANYFNLELRTREVETKKPIKAVRCDRRFLSLIKRILEDNYPYFCDPIPPDKPYREMTDREILVEVGCEPNRPPHMTAADVATLSDAQVAAWLDHLGIETVDPHNLGAIDPETCEEYFRADTAKDGEDPYRPPTGADAIEWLTDHRYRRQFRQDQRLAMLRELLKMVELPEPPFEAFSRKA